MLSAIARLQQVLTAWCGLPTETRTLQLARARMSTEWPGCSFYVCHLKKKNRYRTASIDEIIIIIIFILYCTTLAKRRLLRRVRVKTRGWECSCVRVCVHVRVCARAYAYVWVQLCKVQLF